MHEQLSNRYPCVPLLRPLSYIFCSNKVLKIRPRFDDVSLNIVFEEFNILTTLQAKHHIIGVDGKLELEFEREKKRERNGELKRDMVEGQGNKREIFDVLVFPYIVPNEFNSNPDSYPFLWSYAQQLFEVCATDTECKERCLFLNYISILGSIMVS